MFLSLFFIFREGNDPNDTDKVTYSELLKSVCKFANVLKSIGVTKGDRVAIYMPMILEIAVAMLACARKFFCMGKLSYFTSIIKYHKNLFFCAFQESELYIPL